MPKGTPGRAPCSVDGCDRLHYGLGWCSMHYVRAKKNDGDPGPAEPMFDRGAYEVCSIEGCDRPHEAKGMCTLHYGRKQMGRDIPPEVKDARPVPEGVCIYNGCTEPMAYKRGYCTLHYNRWKDNPDDLGPVGPKPKGNQNPRPAIQRVLDNTHIPAVLGACWEFLSPDPTTGYGLAFTGSKKDGTNRTRGAHVIVSEHFDGPVPPGWEVDHLCYNRACVYPAHLEQVPKAENLRRAMRVRMARKREAG